MSFQRYRGGWVRTALAVGLLLLAVCPVDGGGPASEYAIKAAFLYNFAQFVQWPASAFSTAGDNFVVGVFGRGELPPDLQAVNGRTVPGEGHQRVILLKPMNNPDEVQGCQILFILRSEESRLPEIMRAVDSRSILTVLEDCPDLARNGAVINLYKTPEQHVRFELDIDAAKRANLKIDSPLLNVAKLVRAPKTE